METIPGRTTKALLLLDLRQRADLLRRQLQIDLLVRHRELRRHQTHARLANAEEPTDVGMKLGHFAIGFVSFTAGGVAGVVGGGLRNCAGGSEESRNGGGGNELFHEVIS